MLSLLILTVVPLGNRDLAAQSNDLLQATNRVPPQRQSRLFLGLALLHPDPLWALWRNVITRLLPEPTKLILLPLNSLPDQHAISPKVTTHLARHLPQAPLPLGHQIQLRVVVPPPEPVPPAGRHVGDPVERPVPLDRVGDPLARRRRQRGRVGPRQRRDGTGAGDGVGGEQDGVEGPVVVARARRRPRGPRRRRAGRSCRGPAPGGGAAGG